ncbi:MAG: M20/M25/M40 family metallo-hydrolase [Firmicutes bacterium]|nr:M20/M25/M40 family metallo-hydrolase [Bacillota bacterium]MDH7494530.1 M20/M25/M40 family metallo-hydrolase [Bacillota bacterium]
MPGRGALRKGEDKEMSRLSSRSRALWALVGVLVLVTTAVGAALAASPLDDAFAYVDSQKEAILQDWLALIRIPAPSRQEDERAAWVKARMQEIGLVDIGSDDAGNVWGAYPVPSSGPILVFAAHMDTVFSKDTPINPEVKEGKIFAPGSGDNTSSVVGLLYTAKAIKAAGIVPKCRVIFLATVEEEIGLNGMRYFLENSGMTPDYVVAVDGGFGGVTYGALGIEWYKATLKVPGGHTLSSTGKPSGARSLAAAISKLYEIPLNADPRCYMNVGTLGGGTVPNAIAAETWFTVDMRSQSATELAKLRDQVHAAIKDQAKATGAEVSLEPLTIIPAGLLPGAKDHKLTRVAAEALKAVGVAEPGFSDAGACDSNASIAKGIYSVAVGVTKSQNGHSVNECSEIEPIYAGIKQLVYIASTMD